MLAGATQAWANRDQDSDQEEHDRGRACAIEVLSSEPSLISGGSALVRVTLPNGTVHGGVTITAAGKDVSRAFKEVAPGELLGLVEGLPLGESKIAVKPKHGSGLSDSLEVRNWPITGPIISGPHQVPYYCQTEQFTLPDGSKLGPALDANCTVATRVHYLCRAAGGGALKPLPSTS
jgi:hypothetical protein